MDAPPRSARLVLVTPDGTVAGALPPIPVATPWWQDVGPLVTAVRERWGVEVTILRLLHASQSKPPGGDVTYLAETTYAPAGMEPWDGVLDDQPMRQTYARRGGPAADVAWAREQLAANGVTTTGRADQIRTWNLSSLWRIPFEGGAAWLKVVPPFFEHEGAILAHLAGRGVPSLLAHEGPRCLLAELPGEDLYEASLAQRKAMIDHLVSVQVEQAGCVEGLHDLGLPDWRAGPLIAAINRLAERVAPELGDRDRASIDAFLGGLLERMAQVAGCGLPDTLVHGDFHSGNFRGQAEQLILLDWGDSGVGNPLLDQPAFLDRAAAGDVPDLTAHWRDRWKAHLPGCDPARAAHLIAPVAAARQAVIYQGFLDRIEPAEHPYHRADPAEWLARTATLVRHESRS